MKENQLIKTLKTLVVLTLLFTGLAFSGISESSEETGQNGGYSPSSEIDYNVSDWQSNKLSTLKYNLSFRKHTRQYIPTLDWRLIKAQCFQESAFNEEAVSHVGAKGLCQFMPGTWEDEITRAGITGHPFNYDLNIQMAVQYMSRLIRGWSSPRPQKDRISLALASYNAGFGNLLKSQQFCDNPNLFNQIMICLPCITGRHSEETTQYVFRIWAFYSELVEIDKY